ncbi:HD domain-containing phosphohydrolase [Uliginosibacterium sp. H3]|uniref:HD domain-containing phosphohydrolase n=1 Tax=Uliginosibacterium silvisoli TaxID=3114758 RepID=A0ABU6K918_9RHOO|nr:HD domain-containing phosphohydrolase [Uliginosibacterium sp. H3]
MQIQTQLLGLALNQLRIDTALPWNLYDEAGHLLLTKGFILVRNAQVDSLIERGVFVREEDFKLYNYPDVVRAAPPPAELEIDPFRMRELIASKLALLLRDAAHDPSLVPDFAAKIGEIARVLHKLCDLHLDATLAAIYLTDHAKYPILHSIDTAVLVDLLARKMDWNDARRRTAVCAALTMNIAMIDAQTILALQRLPLSAVQKEAITTHPAQGADMLRAAGVSDELWLRIVADHHEVPDGTGYPAGKTTLDDATLLVRTMDIYTALVTPRHTKAASDTAQAARNLFVQENKYGNTLVGLLIKEIGLHPPGSYVKLKNGDIAVVFKRASATTPPMVHSFINGKGLPMLEPMWRDATRPEFAIASALPREAVTTKVDLLKIWSAHPHA